MKLSIIIPSYKDPLLHKTIDDILENSELGDELEIVISLDGYWTEKPIRADKRIKIVHLGRNRGMRGAINAGMFVAKGEFVGRLDEHCSFGKGFDKVLTNDCQPNTIISPRRYFLNPVKWEIIKECGYVDYERLVIQDMGNGIRKFSGQKWKSRTEERKDIMVDENQGIQGSFWVMPHKLWDDLIGELQTEGFGPTYQDSVEVCMKIWKAGGKLLLTKKTWYSHKHRSFSRTHQEGTKENPSKREESWTYSMKMFEEYYKNELLPRWKK